MNRLSKLVYLCAQISTILTSLSESAVALSVYVGMASLLVSVLFVPSLHPYYFCGNFLFFSSLIAARLNYLYFPPVAPFLGPATIFISLLWWTSTACT